MLDMAQEKLIAWRGKRSLKEVAPLVGFSDSYISMLENGEREISMAVAKAYLAAAPDYFTPNDFYAGTE